MFWTTSAIEDLKVAVSFKGNEAVPKKVNALRELRRLLCRPDFPFVEVALKCVAISLLGQCLSIGSEDGQEVQTDNDIETFGRATYEKIRTCFLTTFCAVIWSDIITRGQLLFSGTCARLFKSEVQFGYAGAKSGVEMESAQTNAS